MFGGTHDIDQRMSFHTLRHIFGSFYAQRTDDLLRLQQILGHASYRTTEKICWTGSARRKPPKSTHRERMDRSGLNWKPRSNYAILRRPD